MNRYEPGGISYPRRRDDWVRDHPLASRLLIMIVGFAVLIPIGLVVKASQGNVVRSGRLPGAAMAADPSSTPATVAADEVAPSTTAKKAASTTAAKAAPATTAAKKPATTAAP